MAKQSPTKSFEQILLEAIDEALSSLGENVATSIYFHLDALFKIKKQEIPAKIDDLLWALTRIFGLGARSLEIMFMKNLYSKIGAAPQRSTGELTVPEITFQEYIRMVKKNLEEADANEEELQEKCEY